MYALNYAGIFDGGLHMSFDYDELPCCMYSDHVMSIAIVLLGIIQ